MKRDSPPREQKEEKRGKQNAPTTERLDMTENEPFPWKVLGFDESSSFH